MTEASPPPAARKPSLLRSSLIFSSLTLVSRFMGLARDLVITAKLGASTTIAADTFQTALAFPNLFRRIFAEGAFTAAFVPAYSRTLDAEGKDAADKLATDALATLAAATLVLTVVAQLAMPWLMYAINPGYADHPEKFRLAVILTQICMPYLPCMAIVALLSGVLNARDRFILSGAAPTVLNAAMLVAVLTQTEAVAAAKAASWGVVAAGILQAAWLWWGVRRVGARVGVVWPKLTPDIKALIALALPGAFAASATQINIFISGNLASFMDGARSWLSVADRFYQLPLGLVGVAIGVALLPRLSQAISRKDEADAQVATDQAVVFALALTLPAAAAMVAMPFYLIDGLFTREQFTAYDAGQTALALFYYGLGTPAFVLNRILSPVFFARSDTKKPMQFALISVGVNVVLGIALFFLIGFQGIAAATAIASWINVGQMVWTLHKRGDYRPTAKAWGKMARILLASALMGGLLAAAAHFRRALEAPLAGFSFHGLGAKEITVLLIVAIGAAIYPALLFATGGLTPAEMKAALRRQKSDPPATA